MLPTADPTLESNGPSEVLPTFPGGPADPKGAAGWVSGSMATGPRAALEVRVLGRDRAEVLVDGQQPLALSRRLSEVLVLLGASRRGLTGEQLAIALYGDYGNPLSARAEVCRLRRVLGRWILTEPYRLIHAIGCDIAALRELLCRGHLTTALETYHGPLLPNSDAPGIVDLRDEIDEWVRRAVMSGDDPEHLWRWLATPSGEDDVQAWKRFLADVELRDGRRSLAAARLHRLRATLAVHGRRADHALIATPA